MKNSKLLPFLVIFLFQFPLLAQKDKGMPLPLPEESIDRVIRQHDPESHWPQFSGEMRLFTIHPNDGVTEEDLLLDNNRRFYESTRYEKNRQITIGTSQDQVFRAINGQTDLSQEVINEYNLTEEQVRWMSQHHRSHFGLPMYLKAMAGPPSSIQKVEFAGKECLQLRFEPPATLSPNPYFTDAISIYVDPANSMMTGMLYEGNIGKDNQGVYVIFNKTIEVDGILIPQVKTYYNRSDDSYWFTDFFHPHPRVSHLSRETEEESIRKVLDEETIYFYTRDYNKWASCWSHQSDVYFAYTSANTFVMCKGWEEVKEHMKNFMRDNPDPHSPPIERSNFVFHLQDDLAWVYFDNREGEVYGKQQRVLRKENGQWKIINVTAFDASSYDEE